MPAATLLRADARPAGTPRIVLQFALILASVLCGVGVASAQTLSSPPQATDATGPVSRSDAGRGATLTARYRVRQMENVLERAVQHAADLMRRRLHAVTPDVLALAGSPRVQGFRIDGYGLFFSVEVPRLSESVNWALRALSQDRDERVLSSLKKVAAAEEDPVVRADIERAIRTVELQVSTGIPRPAVSRAQRRPPSLPPASADRAVEAAVVAESHADGPTASAPAPAEVATATLSSAPVAPESAAEMLVDPSVAYEDEVKQALVDAMLDYAGSLELPDAEWVTVAARDAGYVAFPDAVSDMVTVTLSVRVADLVAFRAQRLTRPEARSRVVVREF